MIYDQLFIYYNKRVNDSSIINGNQTSFIATNKFYKQQYIYINYTYRFSERIKIIYTTLL